MVIVNLMGGLGNQMFQYSFGRFLSYSTRTDLILNTNTYATGQSSRNYDLDIFKLSSHNLVTEELANYLLKQSGLPVLNIEERFFHYDDMLIKTLKTNLLDLKSEPKLNISISGYWQSYRYFDEIHSILEDDFSFQNCLAGKWEIMADRIKNCESVMINVRRGDYLQKLDYHGVVSVDYIEKAIRLIRSKLKHPTFYVFSDDMEWCMNHLTFDEDIIFVGEEYYDQKYQYYLQLMASCKHFIISNSTFSWWAAWLSKNVEKIVIAPDIWFTNKDFQTKDLLRQNWIKL
ncbi:alpha-1,2-fucosyltransferase [Pedobacter panaciterrae]|uniref:alpha-1,2-fucosyltransferase n=1 Tax=Pedobacter panaciterrae TaxID=363849 RepID=UPI002598DF9F|nr:alpha-1,2-fucosyltransferase [uncultured Pedobacter sp.]